MKDILIFKTMEELQPVGGPAGYLYNLNLGLKHVNKNELSIEFLPSMVSKNQIKRKLKQIAIFKKIAESKFYISFKHYLKVKKAYNTPIHCSMNINEFKSIHFHTTIELYRMRDSLESYKGKVFLTPHSPVPLYEELVDKMGIWRKLDKAIVKKLANADEYAFLRADYIIMPCEYADDCYESKWPSYSEIKKKKYQNYRYILTGVKKREVTCSRKEYRKKFGIPENAFIVGYVGRHNEIKGYDQLLILGKEMLERYENLFFLIGGVESPLKGLADNRWIETGWIDKPQNLINAADVLILPNKETYFDIVLIEAISIGIPVIASATGGNKVFDGEKGIKLYDNHESCMNEILSLMNMSAQGIDDIRASNMALYSELFNENVFAEHYINLMKGLLSE